MRSEDPDNRAAYDASAMPLSERFGRARPASSMGFRFRRLPFTRCVRRSLRRRSSGHGPAGVVASRQNTRRRSGRHRYGISLSKDAYHDHGKSARISAFPLPSLARHCICQFSLSPALSSRYLRHMFPRPGMQGGVRSKAFFKPSNAHCPNVVSGPRGLKIPGPPTSPATARPPHRANTPDTQRSRSIFPPVRRGQRGIRPDARRTGRMNDAGRSGDLYIFSSLSIQGAGTALQRRPHIPSILPPCTYPGFNTLTSISCSC